MNYKDSEFQAFSHQILFWYRSNPRDLPWRGTQDPYKIWLSEIILQQTRVAQGLPYYYKFVNQYPTVKDLALAPQEEVLRLWQGLGYYSRARNLHSCAIYIYKELDGKFPTSYEGLLKLKGVGSYTASAIASFAFGEAKAVVDGNVFRVLARYFGIETDIASSKAKKEFESLANKIIPQDEPGEFNQAIMDFGSRQCVPLNPDCESCPLSGSCFAKQQNMVKELPVKINKVKVKERNLHYYVVKCGNEWVWKKRTSGDIWEGLFDFPLSEKEKPTKAHPWEDFEAEEIQEYPKKYRHILSHQKLNATFSELEIPQKNKEKLAAWCEEEGFLLVNEEQIDYLAKPKLIVNFLTDQGI
ncbi:A/G-specific adenine glycosylase [Algoriphagus pacificus]|uniref:Adenine DNA glycosylase n=1 Tax=Algoriphagus pacificus TaxID=2811234 RepID=A0ABS3CBN0_9BACT|nr:A/G-specific adenine glycosylase [Algoriphagus pacificus]MBN7814519.1 A/G-specific adenine glycosylase [Algoriphagus pacificus]